ncbi:hypothetical protein HY339_02855 [Candidatus Gottesmanbacteria bacterium]|nr:hypothetical protein [Candidatus Gottesmanbacteria bacterium]
MNTVRTTVVFDAMLYRQLSVQAAVMGLGLSELVNQKLANANVGSASVSTEEKIAKNLTFFRALGKKMGKTNWAKLVREERDRDRG